MPAPTMAILGVVMVAGPTFGPLSSGDCIKIRFINEYFSPNQSPLNKETMKIGKNMTICISTDHKERDVSTAKCDGRVIKVRLEREESSLR